MDQASISGRGLAIEMYLENHVGDLDDSIDYPILRMIADDENEEQFLEFNCNGRDIQLPISAIKKMIAAAEQDVHSEAWYVKNVFDKK